MNKDLIDVIRLMNDKPIAFNKHYVFLGTGINGAVMLSQLVYWADKTKNRGWIYKTSKEWTAETGLTRREQDTARMKLKNLGFIEEHLHGTPAKVHYRVLENNLYKALVKFAKEMGENEQKLNKITDAQIRQTDAQIRQTDAQIRQTDAQIRQTDAQIRQTNTENTTENTTESTNNKKYIKKKKTFSFRDELIKLGADQQLIDDFCLVREKKKAVDSLTAFNKFMGQQQKSGMSLNTVLELCIEKSWKGFEVKWLKQQQNMTFNNHIEQHGFIDFTKYREQ